MTDENPGDRRRRKLVRDLARKSLLEDLAPMLDEMRERADAQDKRLADLDARLAGVEGTSLLGDAALAVLFGKRGRHTADEAGEEG